MNENGKMSGKGVMTSHHGSRFVGQFKEGRKQGFGVHVFEEANVRERFVFLSHIPKIVLSNLTQTEQNRTQILT